MGFTSQERINLNSKVLAAGVKDANEVGQWYESFFANSFVLKSSKVWANPDLQTLLDNPAPNLATAQSIAMANSTIIQDYSDVSSAVRLTEVPGSNGSTYVAFSSYNDLGSTQLDNWIQPQFVPRADAGFEGYPSIGYAVRLFEGDPNSGGTEVSTSDGQTGSGSSASVAWVFDYANGMLLISADYRGTITDPYILGFRYIGSTLDDISSSVLQLTIKQYQESITVNTLGQTEFVLSNDPMDDGYVQMFVNGSKQQYGTDYIGTGTLITYTGSMTLDVTDDVEFWYLAIGTSEGIGQEQISLPVTIDGQTSFTLPSEPLEDGYVQMFVNGLKQQYGIDYTGTGTDISYIGSVDLEIDDDVEFWYLTGSAADPVTGGTQTLAETLGYGNITGGYDIELSPGSVITSESNGSGTGAAITLVSGTGGGTGGSGNISITTPDNGGATGDTGSIQIETGDGNAGGAGSILIATGNGGGSSTGSGSIDLYTGIGNGGDVGNISIYTGETGGGSAGNITIGTLTSGQATGSLHFFTGFATSGAPGNISIAAGDSQGVSDGGEIYLSTGDSDTGNAGDFFLSTGGVTTSGNGGTIYFSAGFGGSTSGNGGGFIVTAGNSSTSSSAGSVYLTGGNNTSSGVGGSVILTSGSSTSGIDGDIVLNPRGSGAVILTGNEVIKTNDDVATTDSLIITTGTNTSTNPSGDITIVTGGVTGGTLGSGSVSISSAANSGHTGTTGSVSLFTGDGSAGSSGNVNIYSGAGNAGGSGSVNITIGDGQGGAAGDLNLVGGSAGSSGTGSNINISAGISTGGFDGGMITLTPGTSVSGSDGYVDVIGDLNVTGKLTVAGLIDPTGLVLTEQSSSPYNTNTNEGMIWVRDDGYLMFTDQTDTDHTIDLDGTGGGSGSVTSVFGRVGAVISVSGDYDSDQITNVSTVSGASVSDALETLNGLIVGGGGGTVSGPDTTTDNAIVRWDGADGYSIQNSGIIIDDSGNITGVTTINGVVVETHASRHENGGTDEISVTGLSGLLADPQTPETHASSHESGAGDELDGYNLAITYVPSNYNVPINDIIGEHFYRIDEALASVGSLSPVITEYRFSNNTTTADPGAGRFRLNNADPALATELYFSSENNNGADITNIIELISSGIGLYIQESNDATTFVVATVSSAPVDNTGWFTVGISVSDNNGTFSNNQTCGLTFFSGSSGSLTAPIPDQDGYIAIASGGDFVYLKGTSDGDVLTWNEISETWESSSVPTGGLGPTKLTVLAGLQSTDTTGFSVISAFEFDAADYDGYSTITFNALIETSNAADDVEIRLYNLTGAYILTSSILSSSSTETVLVTTDITSDINPGSGIYEVQLRLTTTGSPNLAICKRAELLIE